MVKGYRDLMVRGKARDWLYITSSIAECLGRASELGRMRSGLTRKTERTTGRNLAPNTWHLTPGT